MNFISEKRMTKFTGGGLQWGKGTIDCLKRECREELGCEIKIAKHFYTTDFFQPSAFHADHQLISIYYIVKGNSLTPALSKEEGITRPLSPPLGEPEGASQSFRWISISEINAGWIYFFD